MLAVFQSGSYAPAGSAGAPAAAAGSALPQAGDQGVVEGAALAAPVPVVAPVGGLDAAEQAAAVQQHEEERAV
jgi:hypothetical protein